jgi:uncharacterized cupredoxin-like copper-binding protein
MHARPQITTRTLVLLAALGLVMAGCGKISTPTGAVTNGSPTTAAPAASTTTVATPTATPAAAGESAPNPITLKEFKVGLPSTTVAPATYTVNITNAGTVQHELLVFRSDLSPDKFPLDSTGDIQEDGPGITKISDGDNIDPGKSQARTIDLNKPGSYVFVCNLPGHFRQGMFTQVTVQAPPSRPPLPVDLSEFKVSPATTTVAAGTYTLSINNVGTVQHELLIFKTSVPPTQFPLEGTGIKEDDASIDKVSDGDNIDPGKSQARTVDFTQPGTYVLVCNLPGHFKQGMYSVVTVA